MIGKRCHLGVVTMWICWESDGLVRCQSGVMASRRLSALLSTEVICLD